MTIIQYNHALKTHARALWQGMTDAEQTLWSKLRRKQIHGVQFYRQKPLGGYIVDFYAPGARLVIELDGSQHYEQEHAQRDAVRDSYLQGLRLQVLRFNNLQVLQELEAVLGEIARVVNERVNPNLDQKANPPQPPFCKGGSEDVSNLEGSEDVSNLEESEDVFNLEGSEDVSNLEGSEDVSNLEGSEDVFNLEGSEDVFNLEGSEDVSNLEGSEDVSNLKGSEDVSNLKGSEDVSNLEGSEDVPTLEGSEGVPTLEGSEDVPTLEGSEDVPTLEGSEDVPPFAKGGLGGIFGLSDSLGNVKKTDIAK
ncbi:MAG: hypothetical protein A2Z65_02810 [Gallionellales bacterium RIFCSPLOWO2_02_58_13]|nr:MAG: hypothetical protein A2Z65_02810 [Gallionellales bacterium RIFCSPLOWO2_02_58_13]